MNTATLHETTAIAAAVAAVTASQELLLIPLSKLRPSSRNVRKSGGTSIPELAASIARVGLLQNLNVVLAADGEHYEVVAGRRRLAALKLLVKRRKLAKDFEVACLLGSDAAARTVSLTENVQREAMHPADQFEAFADLVAEGRPIEDIAADFGVTPLVVQRRLKLANVSPRLLADYRGDAVTLEQLMALAITDDHAAQEAAYYESPQWQRSPEALRDHLTHEEIDAGRDALAKFVSVQAYEQAGGDVRRDLFADEQNGIFLTDGALLDSLAKDRLAPMAEQVQAEGWGWVDVAPRATYADLHQFQRMRSKRREPSKAEAKRIAKLEAQQRKLQDRLDDENEDMTDVQAQAMQDEMDGLGNEVEAIERTLVVYPPRTMATAGAVVSLDHMGGVIVHRGLLREEQAKALREQERGGSGANDDTESSGAAEAQGKLTISEKLVKRLSAHRTAALQAEVARHPQVALVAVAHRLALRVIHDAHYGSPLNITANPQDRLEQYAPDVAEAPAAVGMRQVREAWAERLPNDSDALFTELLAMPQQELLSLLAVCVGFTVTALASREDEAPAAALAQAVGLDMHAWWTPTSAGYFDHVSKAKALEGVQVFASGEVNRLGKLKKADIASEAERLAAGTGWLPAMFRAQEATAVDVAGAEPLAEGQADAEAQEDAHAAA
ncbi:ParB/RepB/Spo0J family partition protein [Variovorax sp. J22G21]|uniref:ParB/RepB/Spo0J family partition protein n=1 Tax=Variovorax fucosicus TaxID=3053517 RepID=UPI0025786011|nr:MULTISPECIES: ParB/RepB/Spo0J family partition protein [unclassified Variovorax]MDM0037423.1 ParB/RepB/Spo0J family partition protein [Variovorax sp. J22R193]MDM0062199.1 ParB/RepB/Spo0J family partition protein [Variovorax sp. J22G21]